MTINKFFVPDPPKVFLKFGSNINTEEIIEDSDVYFDCIIDANPSIYKVEWHRNVSKAIVKENCSIPNSATQ